MARGLMLGASMVAMEFDAVAGHQIDNTQVLSTLQGVCRPANVGVWC